MRWRGKLDGFLSLGGLKKIDNRSRALLYLLWMRPEGSERLPSMDLVRSAGLPPEMPEAMPKGFPGGVAAFNSFPGFLYEEMAKERGAEEAALLAASFNSPARPVLRCNSLAADRPDAMRILFEDGIESQPTPFSPWGIVLPGRKGIENSRAYKEGLVEIQDEGSQLSMIPGHPKPGETVLDLCAGAGGKTLLAAMMMENRGRIVASDPDERKLAEVRRRAARAGASIVETISPSKLKKEGELLGAADLVIIDAPCSGTGTLRRSPDLKWRLSPGEIEARIEVQRKLLEGHYRWLRPGGRLAYITCSVLGRENEGQVERFLAAADAVVLDAGESFKGLSIAAGSMITREGFFKTDPRHGEMDGFFSAVFKREEYKGVKNG